MSVRLAQWESNGTRRYFGLSGPLYALIHNSHLLCIDELDTPTMKSERWLDVPGYEGLYKVSNTGRVKALRKITEGKKRAWMPEQIQRITVDLRKNNQGKKVPGSTFATMAKNGRKKMVSIPRLVYYLFVDKFNLKDPAWRIYYKEPQP